MLRAVFSAVLFGAMVIAAAYEQRGYWSIGAEVILPIILLVVLLKGEKKENGS